MDAYINPVVRYLLAQSWQVALLAAIVALISFALRNRSAHIRYLLWLIVLAKCLVPPFLTVPLAVLPERPSSPSVARVDLQEEHSAPETPVSVGGATQPQELKPAVPSARALIALVWTAGAIFFLLWVGGRAVRYTTWLRDRRRPLPLALQESIRESSAGFKFRKLPTIWLLEDISQPFVWGVLRGSVYLPADFVGLNGSDQQRSILAHELSHIARFDAGVNLLQVMAQAAYWFHPLVWWANRKIRQEREKCCDEMAIAHLNTQPEQYTGAILDALAAERRSAHRIPSLAIVGSVKDIEERIRTMLKPGKKFHKRPSLVAATVALLIAFVTIPTALVLTARAETQQTTAQSADQPAQLPNKTAVDGEKPEQPRYAARTFNSKMAFSVWRRTSPQWSRGWMSMGRTPSDTPLEIPACYIWWVRPEGPAIDWDLVVREIRENKVPGLVWGAMREATDSDVKRLADLTGLEFLDLNGALITDAGLEHVKGLTGLLYLELNCTRITDAGLEQLKGLTRLECLELYETRVTDAGLAHLRGLARLERLTLSSTKIADAGLEHLQALTRLQQLDLTNTQITDVGLAHLKNLTTLQTLSVESTQITDAGLAHLAGLTGLQDLDLTGTQVTDAGLEHLKALTGLQSVSLEKNPITGAGLAHLKSLTGLECLVLTDTRITDAGLEHLEGLTGLTDLWLNDTRITDAGLAHLKGLTRLEILGLSGTQVTDAGLEHLQGLSQLRTVHLSDTRITGAGLAHIEGLTRLQTLHLCRTPITDTGLAHLEHSAGLGFLNLYGTKITDAGLAHLKGLDQLWLLILSGTQITDMGLEHLKGLSKVSSLYLTNTRITDAGLVHLQGLTRLGFLDLSGTQVTDAGVQRLKQSLPKLNIRRDGVMEDWIKKG